MNFGKDLRHLCDRPIDRRRWLAGLTALGGLAWAGRAGRANPERPPGLKPVSDRPDEPMVIDHEGYRVVANPARLAGNSPVPLAFLFGGNGLGAVVRSEQADQLADDLAGRGVASVIVNYPNLTSQADLVRHIVAPMTRVLESRWAARNRIDPGRIGVAGFSAGGLIATLLATRYRHRLPMGLLSSLNYYGPVDLRHWFAFHAARAEHDESATIDPFYQGRRGPDESGHSVRGTVLCRELSRSVRAKVAENIGGLAPGKLAAFSDERVWLAPESSEVSGFAPAGPRLIGAFGTLDDNIDADFHPRVLRRLGQVNRLEAMAFTYEGPHGVSWRACPPALEAFLQPLLGESVLTGKGFATAKA